ncbi:hypothetical protein OIE73_13725 [Streptomyces hirsutus]|uniref:Uncharacterized protein n=1 Tax=Streptomyces hirsutus TaxID=35620 RepID=A0ABZ1GPW1_9ACTN|nr:hypothetical protein [Streptomyces hirsutus]WSD06728.1 hypothetical protein OIE73_13725 [Streptomyces hirsutus]
MTQEHDALHAAPAGRGEAPLAPFSPHAHAEEIARTSRMCASIHKGGPEPLPAREGAERDARAQEPEDALFHRLGPPLLDPYPLGV